MYYKTSSYRAFTAFNYVLLTIICLSCVLPLIHILAVSFSASAPANSNLVGLWPIGFNFEAYEKTLNNPNFHNALLVGLQRTVLGTVIGMSVMTLAGYALSKDTGYFKSRSIYMWYFLFTMLFSGGIVPSYMLIRELNLMNTMWALVLPLAINVFNMVLLMNFFRAVPRELEEASLIDGAGHFRTLISVYLPVSMPAIATISLFTMVMHWNSWFDGLLYISDYRKYPLSTFYKPSLYSRISTRLIPMSMN